MIALPRSRRIAVAAIATFAVLVLGYGIWVAFLARGPVGPRVGYGPDSAVYISSARQPVWSRDFLSGPGAFGFLLLAKVCARNLRAIVMVQSLLAVGAWTLLATTAVAVFRSNRARWLAFGGILGVGLAPGVVQWNAFITTESLSLSLLCVVIAFGLRVAVNDRRRDLALFVAALAAFAYTRDTNAIVAGVLALVMLTLAVLRAWRVRGLVIGIAGLVLAFSATALADRAEPPRWYWPLAETTAIRLLADPGATRYIADRGFPLDAQTRSLPRRYIFITYEVKTSPHFRAFRHWIEVDGRHVYLSYLLSHPGWSLRKPFDDRDALFDLGRLEGYSRVVYHDHPGGPFAVIGTVAAPKSAKLVEIWAGAAALALAAVAWRRARGRSLFGAITVIGALAIVAYYAAWHGDALEVYRHALSATVELRIALWLATAAVVDGFVTRRSGRSPVGVPGETDLDGEEHERAPGDEERRDLDPAPAG